MCRWSAIAAKLPGRTDNEIKNVWHTHLKKRLKNNHNHNHGTSPPKRRSLPASHIHKQQKSINSRSDSQGYGPVSPQYSFSDISSAATTTTTTTAAAPTKMDSPEDCPEILDENFWSEVLSSNTSAAAAGYQFSPLAVVEPVHGGGGSSSSSYNSYDMDMEFWYNIFTRSGELHELPEI